MSKIETTETVEQTAIRQAAELGIVVKPAQPAGFGDTTIRVGTTVVISTDFLKNLEANTATIRTMLDKLFKDLGGDVVTVDIS